MYIYILIVQFLKQATLYVHKSQSFTKGREHRVEPLLSNLHKLNAMFCFIGYKKKSYHLNCFNTRSFSTMPIHYVFISYGEFAKYYQLSVERQATLDTSRTDNSDRQPGCRGEGRVNTGTGDSGRGHG